METLITTIPINSQQFFVKSPPPFLEGTNDNLFYLEAHMAQTNPTPLCFVGPKGTGKTLVVAYFASKHSIPIIQYDCSENTRKGDLIGRYVLRGDETAYQLGVLPSAIELANEVGRAILVFEELNALAPNMQKQLNQLLDWRRHVFADNGKTYRLNQGAKLLICATMNPSTYGGVFELNEDLISRWANLNVNYPSIKLEEEIAQRNGFDCSILPTVQIKNSTIGVHQITTKMIWKLVQETRAGKGLSYSLSTRDIVQFLTGYQDYLPSCLKKEAEDKKLIKYMNESLLFMESLFFTGEYPKHNEDKLRFQQSDEFKLWTHGSTNAFNMALYSFIIGKYQDPVEQKTIRQRISSIFPPGILNE